MPCQLAGKTALITGAGRGIGRALALALADRHLNLILASRTPGTLDEIATKAVDQTKGQVMAQALDVGDQAAVEKLAAEAGRAFGQIDILVNNAGEGYAGKVLGSDPDQVRRMIDSNLWGLYLVTRFCLPLMSGGDIVNISSVAGMKYSPGFAMYSATKFAVRAFSEGLRNEAQDQGIRVLTVYPGMTDTDFFQRFAGPGQSPVPTSGGQLLHPAQVAEAIVHALEQPPGVAINELVIRPSWQER